VIHVSEKHEYVLSAMKKAKMNYDICAQKVAETKAAITTAQANRDNAQKRLAAASIAMADAMRVYQESIIRDGTTSGLELTATQSQRDQEKANLDNLIAAKNDQGVCEASEEASAVVKLADVSDESNAEVPDEKSKMP
jgi:hypothetical protein